MASAYRTADAAACHLACRAGDGEGVVDAAGEPASPGGRDGHEDAVGRVVTPPPQLTCNGDTEFASQRSPQGVHTMELGLVDRLAKNPCVFTDSDEPFPGEFLRDADAAAGGLRLGRRDFERACRSTAAPAEVVGFRGRPRGFVGTDVPRGRVKAEPSALDVDQGA